MSVATLSPASETSFTQTVWPATWDFEEDACTVPETADDAESSDSRGEQPVTVTSCHNGQDAPPAKPATRRGYFDETPTERRVRQQAAKEERIAERETATRNCLECGDRESLIGLYECLVLHIAWRLRSKFKLDDATFDDVVQVGTIQPFQRFDAKLI